ncbi:alpha/beta hydrolase, partial [Streptomyces zhihengii]
MLLVPPPFDPDLAAALAAVGPSAPSGLSLEEITALHAGPDIAVPAFDLTQDGAFVTTDRTAPGPEGAPDVSLFVATPATPPQDGQPRPVIYHAHGGGMILGNNRAGVEVVLEWATELDAIVVSVEYRLAPEHPYPAGVEDVYAGLLWTARHVAEFGGDPERIVVAGASAGGGLTAALALLSRDRGGPRAIGQVLMYPMLDDRNDTPSAYQMAGVGAWDRTANETAWTAVLGDARGGPDVPSYAAPARATDLAGLPPAFLDVGSAETFRDEVVDYASRIWQAGGVAELHVWPGGFHGFDSFAPDTPLSRTA